MQRTEFPYCVGFHNKGTFLPELLPISAADSGTKYGITPPPLAGDVVFMSSYALGRSPALWEDASEFRPVRKDVFAVPDAAVCS